jgi:hypothetical protein
VNRSKKKGDDRCELTRTLCVSKRKWLDVIQKKDNTVNRERIAYRYVGNVKECDLGNLNRFQSPQSASELMRLTIQVCMVNVCGSDVGRQTPSASLFYLPLPCRWRSCWLAPRQN